MKGTLAVGLVIAGMFIAGHVIIHMDREAVSKLPYVHIADVTSDPGESEHAFLIRAADSFREFSNLTGLEACAVIGSTPDGKQFGLVIGSTEAHLACLNDTAHMLPGMQSTGETIHTHGDGKTHELNKVDEIILRLADPYSSLPSKRGENVWQFSPQDYAASGYLVTPTNVLYQHGEGTASEIKP